VPARLLREEPSDERPDRERERRDTSPDPDRSSALTRRKRRGDDREGGGVHQGGAGPLSDACRDQHLPAGGEAAAERRDGEDGDPDDEECAATVRVRELAADQHQRRERQGVPAHDPLELGEADTEVALDGGQRDVHDGVVEHDHEEPERDGRERPPLLVLLGHEPCPHLHHLSGS
jgi:hypothetical protein